MFKKFWKNYKTSFILLSSIILGVILGLVFKEDILVIKPLGTIFVNLCFTIVVPLVFFTISSSIANIKNVKRLGKLLKHIFLTFLVTVAIAGIVMTIVMTFISPMGSKEIALNATEAVTKVNIGEQIASMLTVNDFVGLFSRSNMFALILISVFVGLATGSLKEKNNVFKDFIDQGSKVMLKLVKYIMYYAPIGMGACFACLIADLGPQLLTGYLKSFIIYLVVCVLFFFIFYTLYAYIAGGKKGVKLFYKNIINSVVTSLGTQSSLATLPTNIDAAKKIGIPDDISELSLSTGATMHMEGSALLVIIKIAFLFAVFGRNFTGITTLLLAVLVAIISSCVTAGVPDGNIVGDLLIVSLYGLPAATAFPIIHAIGLIADAPATTMNVVGDVTASMLIAKNVEGKDWLNKQ